MDESHKLLLAKPLVFQQNFTDKKFRMQGRDYSLTNGRSQKFLQSDESYINHNGTKMIHSRDVRVVFETDKALSICDCWINCQNSIRSHPQKASWQTCNSTCADKFNLQVDIHPKVICDKSEIIINDVTNEESLELNLQNTCKILK